jgi:hypothetical protein
MTDTTNTVVATANVVDIKTAIDQGAKKPAKSAEPKAKAPSKSDIVQKLLGRAKGASIAEIAEATGWQPHSVRAFLTGLRKKGLTILRESRKDGETAYRIAN